MKLLLVDDEPIVLSGISSILEKSDGPYEIVAQCENGYDALEAVRRERPDIVMTDIRMGGMSGLELAEKIKEIDETIIVVLLSGYSDFLFAQKALTLGVFEYLVKPTRQAEILSCLERAKARREKSLAAGHPSPFGEASRETREATLERLLRNAAMGLPPDEALFQKARDEGFAARCFFALSIAFTSFLPEASANGQDRFAAGLALREIARKSFTSHGQVLAATENTDGLLVLLCLNEFDERSASGLIHCCENLQDEAQRLLRTRVGIGLSQIKDDLSGLHEALREAEAAIKLAGKESIHVFGRQEQTSYSPPIQKALEYIQAHFTEALSLKTVSAEIFLNAWYFSELFKKEVGKSFTDYILSLRVERAKVLIEDKRLPLYQISYMVGINGPTYFSQVFKRITGLTPKEYRKRRK